VDYVFKPTLRLGSSVWMFPEIRKTRRLFVLFFISAVMGIMTTDNTSSAA
jgi:hypothetical protein